MPIVTKNSNIGDSNDTIWMLQYAPPSKTNHLDTVVVDSCVGVLTLDSIIVISPLDEQELIEMGIELMED